MLAVCVSQGRKKSQKKSADMGNMNWEAERDRGIRAVLQLLRLNVQRLWDPPVMEEEFVTYVQCQTMSFLEKERNSPICVQFAQLFVTRKPFDIFVVFCSANLGGSCSFGLSSNGIMYVSVW